MIWNSWILSIIKKLVALIGYGVFISTSFLIMPENPDEVTAPMNLVNEFRIMSVLGVTSFWVSIGPNS